MKALLALADGKIYEGEHFGAENEVEAEIVFNTSMSGYQEIITDPSYCGQMVVMTYPLIGNYGIHASSSESSSIWPRALICRELIIHPDHRDSIGNVDEFLRTHGVPGLKKVDTRAITKKVREYGTLLCVMGPIEKEEELTQLLEEIEDPSINDLIETSKELVDVFGEHALLSEKNISKYFNDNTLPFIARSNDTIIGYIIGVPLESFKEESWSHFDANLHKNSQ